MLYCSIVPRSWNWRYPWKLSYLPTTLACVVNRNNSCIQHWTVQCFHIIFCGVGWSIKIWLGMLITWNCIFSSQKGKIQQVTNCFSSIGVGGSGTNIATRSPTRGHVRSFTLGLREPLCSKRVHGDGLRHAKLLSYPSRYQLFLSLTFKHMFQLQPWGFGSF